MTTDGFIITCAVIMFLGLFIMAHCVWVEFRDRLRTKKVHRQEVEDIENTWKEWDEDDE